MIVYKWTIKKKDKYYPLVLFGIHPSIWHFNRKGLRKVYPYKLNKTYSEYYDLIPNHSKSPRNLAGFHFWEDSVNEYILKRYNRCMTSTCKKKIKVNAILKCFVDEKDIISKSITFGQIQITAKKFKILGEINNANFNL